MSKKRPFKRQLLGYRRKAVDEHLAVVDASIADLREAVDRAAEPEHHDLVLRATRLAVEDVMQRAHDEALRIRTAAETEAAGVLADAYAIVAAREGVIDLRPEATEDEATTAVATDDTALDDTGGDDTGVDDTDADEPALDQAGPPAEPVDPDWNADLAKVIES